MNTEITKQFVKAAAKTPAPIQKQIAVVILQVQNAQTLSDIHHFKSLYSKKNRLYYRIRIGDYRIGVQVIGNVHYFQTVGIRGDFYKEYPPR